VIDRFSYVLRVMRCARICAPALTRCLQFLYNDCIFPRRRSRPCANLARCILLSTWESRVDGSPRPTRRAAWRTSWRFWSIV